MGEKAFRFSASFASGVWCWIVQDVAHHVSISSCTFCGFLGEPVVFCLALHQQFFNLQIDQLHTSSFEKLDGLFVGTKVVVSQRCLK